MDLRYVHTPLRHNFQGQIEIFWNVPRVTRMAFVSIALFPVRTAFLFVRKVRDVVCLSLACIIPELSADLRVGATPDRFTGCCGMKIDCDALSSSLVSMCQLSLFRSCYAAARSTAGSEPDLSTSEGRPTQKRSYSRHLTRINATEKYKSYYTE
jgi:hypothetical protein